MIGPSLDEASRRPLLGQGFGTRQTGFFNPLRNAPILDNNGSELLEAGILVVIGWASLFVMAGRRLGGHRGAAGGTGGVAGCRVRGSHRGFAAGMFTFDALGSAR